MFHNKGERIPLNIIKKMEKYDLTRKKTSLKQKWWKIFKGMVKFAKLKLK